MASFLHANLPSEDEEDQDFVPDDKEEGAKKKKSKRVRGAAMGAQPCGGDDDDDQARAGPSSAADQELEDARPDPKREAKKAKVDALWQQLNARQPARAAPQAASLSQLCRKASQPRKAADDNAWMRQLGLSAPRPKPTAKPGAAGDAMAAAAAALAAAKQAASSTTAAQHGTVTLQETRRFAGKEVTVAREVATGSKEATKAAAEAESAAKKKAGLDAVLASLEHAKKVTVLDKSRADWGQYKKADETVQEELQAHGRSADQYLERQAFLKSAELRQYEQERDARLGSDIRNRGRL